MLYLFARSIDLIDALTERLAVQPFTIVLTIGRALDRLHRDGQSVGRKNGILFQSVFVAEIEMDDVAFLPGNESAVGSVKVRIRYFLNPSVRFNRQDAEKWRRLIGAGFRTQHHNVAVR